MDKIITYASVGAAIVFFVGWVWRGFSWIKKRNELEQEVTDIKEELAIMTYALLSCLRVQQKQGFDTGDAIEIMEKHINKKAHEVK